MKEESRSFGTCVACGRAYNRKKQPNIPAPPGQTCGQSHKETGLACFPANILCVRPSNSSDRKPKCDNSTTPPMHCHASGSLTSEHAEDADRARAIVGRYHELGYEEIKIYQSLKPELIPVVAAEASWHAMRAATTVPAKIFGITDAGAIAPGQRADLVILDANPLDDIRNIRRVHLTIAGGKAYDPNVLRQIVDIRPASANQ